MASGLTSEGQRTLAKIDAMAKASPQLAFRILKELGADGEKEVIKRTPIDSASMVSTVRKEINVKFLQVILKIGGIRAKFSRKGKARKFVNYAEYVEEGTSRQSGQHMLVKGAHAAVNKKNSIARQAFNSWLAKFK